MFNIPKQITQGDTVSWSETLDEYNPATDTLKCFIRGQSALDLTGVSNGNQWDFTIDTNQSILLAAGKYNTQFVIEFSTNKKALGTTELLVCPSFENMSKLETRSPDEIELEEITKAILKLSSGAVSEYWIGDRKLRYQDLEQLTERQQYLRNRIAMRKNPSRIGGRNVGIKFSNGH